METPIALHSVAHRVSHHIPAESEMSRQNRATPPQINVSHLSPDPACRTFLPHSQQTGGQRGGVSRRAGGGYRGTIGFRKRIALQGGVAATVTPVALHCATVPPLFPMSLYEQENTNSGVHFLLYFGCCWSPTPSRQPLEKD